MIVTVLWCDRTVPRSQWFYSGQKPIANDQNFFSGESNSRLQPPCVHMPFSSLYCADCPHLLVCYQLIQAQALVLLVLRVCTPKHACYGLTGYSTSGGTTMSPEGLNSFCGEESASVLNKRDPFISGVHLSPSPAICGKVEANV